MTTLNQTSADSSTGSEPMADVNLQPLNSVTTLLWNHIFSPTILNQARANVTRYAFNQITSNASETNFGIPRIEVQGFPFGRIEIGPAWSPNTPSIEAENTMDFADTLIQVHGNKTFKYGVDIIKEQSNNNLPCNSQSPCSPDRKWEAAGGSISLDAGQENQFRNARVSCIAGPCPVTEIESPTYSHDRRTLKVSALDWSDTATFLVEAEVDHSTVSDNSRESFPVILGDALSFTLPAGADGLFIEAEINGTPIVFPLGPDLLLDWADCTATLNRDQSKAYRCALKAGYRFQ